MKLSRFILSHLEEILGEWETFARSLSRPGVIVPPRELQDIPLHTTQLCNTPISRNTLIV